MKHTPKLPDWLQIWFWAAVLSLFVWGLIAFGAWLGEAGRTLLNKLWPK